MSDIYGKSPAENVLEDIRVINQFAADDPRAYAKVCAELVAERMEKESIE